MAYPSDPNQDIIALDHQGISSLGCGKFRDAMISFRSALVQSLSCQLQNDQLSNIRITKCKIDGMKGGERSFSDHNTLLIQDSVFQFSLVQDMETLNGEGHLCSLSPALLFNFGLPYHLRAMVLQANGQDFGQAMVLQKTDQDFGRASKLYGMAAEVARRNEVKHMDDYAKHVLLAIYNNKAHISYQFFDLKASRWCLDMMEYILSLCTFQENEDHHIFVTNWLFAQGQETRSAAAA
jgi:hypothetical protein